MFPCSDPYGSQFGLVKPGCDPGILRRTLHVRPFQVWISNLPIFLSASLDVLIIGKRSSVSSPLGRSSFILIAIELPICVNKVFNSSSVAEAARFSICKVTFIYSLFSMLYLKKYHQPVNGVVKKLASQSIPAQGSLEVFIPGCKLFRRVFQGLFQDVAKILTVCLWPKTDERHACPVDICI